MAITRSQKIAGGIGTSIALLLMAAGLLYYLLASPQYHPQQTTYIYIDTDDVADSVYHKVAAAGHPTSLTGLKLLSTFRKYHQHIHTGRYAIRPGDNSLQLFNRLYRGHQTPVNLTIGSARSLKATARQIGKQLMIDSAQVASSLFDSTYQQRLGLSVETLPCLIIPDTYQVYWDISSKKLMERLCQEYQRFWSKRDSIAQQIGFTRTEVCTIASIVDEETNYAPEKATVAGLYINRLHRGMLLQADPTVKFAWQDFSLRRITNEHLLIDSPYNTYAHPGLPPGPIRIATTQAIDAVLHYQRHPFLYMCAKEDFSGAHNFSASYSEHLSNARRYHQALNKRRIYK